jgi:hypothetical protein
MSFPELSFVLFADVPRAAANAVLLAADGLVDTALNLDQALSYCLSASVTVV